MVGTRLRFGLIGAMLAASGALLSPATARAQAAANDSGSLLDTVAVKARLVAARLESQPGAQRGRPGRAEAGLNQYQDGVAQLTRHQFDSALVELRAAVTVGPNNARYHGDLAYVYAGLQRWDDAGTEYATAIRLQGANPWYYVGLGAVRSAQERWAEAGANFALAKATDSTILDPALIAAASYVYERDGNEQQLFDWSQAGTRLFPNDAGPWLRVATLLRSRGDTGQGLAAIRRYHTLQPEDPLGQAVFALYLYDIGQNDSAVALAHEAARDSAMHQYASMVFLRVGARMLQAKNYDRAAQVLDEGRQITPAGLNRLRYTHYLGLANLMRIPTLYNDASQRKDCTQVHVLDSLLTSVNDDISATAQLDSAQAAQILTTYVPQLRQRIDAFKGTCRNE
jgi:tetratricopeptide (TPR) repeat protein